MKIDEIIKEMEAFHKKMTEDMFRGFGSLGDTFPDFDSLEEKVRSGELEGDWSFEPIERPGVNGFIAKGFFRTPQPLKKPDELLPPLKPKLRKPGEPREPREPLYDISVEPEKLTVFVELPGVDEKDIDLDAQDGNLKVKTGAFQTVIDLSGWDVDTDNMDTVYRNGVLKVVIPNKGPKEQLI
jgi:HSP20 family molecular chaperone IbpA